MPVVMLNEANEGCRPMQLSASLQDSFNVGPSHAKSRPCNGTSRCDCTALQKLSHDASGAPRHCVVQPPPRASRRCCARRCKNSGRRGPLGEFAFQGEALEGSLAWRKPSLRGFFCRLGPGPLRRACTWRLFHQISIFLAL